MELEVGGIPLINEIWYRDLPRAPQVRDEEVDVLVSENLVGL